MYKAKTRGLIIVYYSPFWKYETLVIRHILLQETQGQSAEERGPQPLDAPRFLITPTLANALWDDLL